MLGNFERLDQIECTSKIKRSIEVDCAEGEPRYLECRLVYITSVHAVYACGAVLLPNIQPGSFCAADIKNAVDCERSLQNRNDLFGRMTTDVRCVVQKLGVISVHSEWSKA